MPQPVTVHPVHGLPGRRRFVDVPFRLFGADPDWIPPLRMAVYDRISPRHPAAEHQRTALWLAVRDGRPVGRIGACVDRMFNEFQGLSWGWVGFFECVDDEAVAAALFDVARRWLAGQGVDTCVGPASFTTNDECGLLVDGFEHPPMVMTPQTPPYYERLWTANGWQPARDLYGWRLTWATAALSQSQQQTLDRAREMSSLRVRSMRLKDFDAEVERFFRVYNAAWLRNWGFAPANQAEIRHIARTLKRLIDPKLALVAETPDGEPVGVALLLPDINEAMRSVRSGRLLPIGWWRLLRGAKRTDRLRAYALGVRREEEWRSSGVLLYTELFARLRDRPNVTLEASWVLDVNRGMNGALAEAGADRYKTWRMYECPLAEASPDDPTVERTGD